MDTARQQVREAILIAQQRWAHSKYLGRTFKIGDKVWLEGRNLRTEQPTAKLAPKRHGPFPIKKVLSPITYQLTLPPTWKIHDVFHVDLLTPYIETDFHGPNYTRPPPDLINDEEEYEVEQVLSSRRHGRGRKVQYLVKWKGYPDSDNEWVNWDDMNADEALEDFKKQNPRAITHIRRAQSATVEPTPTLHSWIYSNTVNVPRCYLRRLTLCSVQESPPHNRHHCHYSSFDRPVWHGPTTNPTISDTSPNPAVQQ
jgi:hypothetical protein